MTCPDSLIFSQLLRVVTQDLPLIGGAVDNPPPRTVATTAVSARVLFVEALEEDLPPAYEEQLFGGCHRPPFVLNPLPPANSPCWIGRDSYRPSSSLGNLPREVLRTALHSRLPSFCFQALLALRQQLEFVLPELIPISPRPNQSDQRLPSLLMTPPSQQLLYTPPRMKHAELPGMNGQFSAAFTTTMFFQCLRSVQSTLSLFPATHPQAAQLQQLCNKSKLMELWFHFHHENL
jgi:hypothetical protein